MGFPSAWNMISKNAASAANLFDRGEIVEGKRADLVLLDATVPRYSQLAATIVAGNVVCENRTKELIKYGKVDIVKVGIGSGCFDSDTKILLSNGIYKNIIEINEGDKVINKDGKSVNVLNKIYKYQIKIIIYNLKIYQKHN